MFPGQGSQVVVWERNFITVFQIVKKIFMEADEILKFPLSNIISDGPEEELQLTQNTQPAILTVSYSIFQVLKNEFNFDLSLFKFYVGHSLGEYSAFSLCRSIRF